MANLQTVKIFPSIGIARLGNSPEWYVGPELPFPAPPPAPPNGTYKDERCRIKRQAQRFRLWGFFDDSSNRELTAADGTIQWTVHVVNSKTSISGEGIIDPGSRTLKGPKDDATFANGTFLGVEVPLGEAHTDGAGRLIVVGGFGNSGSPNGKPLQFPNSPGWYDDVSDGPITAQITVGGTPFTAVGGAWVICAPPRYAPTSYSVTSLYDTIRQVAIDKGWLTLPATPSFANDIYPILKRALDMRFVTAFVFKTGVHDTLAALIPPASGQAAARKAVALEVNPPGDMPMLLQGTDDSRLVLFQRTFLQKWSDEQSTNDWPPTMPTTITPDGLTQAALENCVGAAFFPGIEATKNTRTLAYTEPFRVDHGGSQPGDLTKGMSRPWQNDFYLCSGGGGVGQFSWWPAARPIGIYPASDPNNKQDWTRGVAQTAPDMVANWHRLGFIVDAGVGKPVETERTVVCKDCFIITDRNEIGLEQAQGSIDAGQPLVDAFYVVVEGFAPSDLGITTPTPTPAQLQAWAAKIALAPPPTKMQVTPNTMLLENNAALNAAQRITFSYNISFTGIVDFTADVVPIVITASVGGVSASATITLTKLVSPYMVDGAISWLSNDTRVFKRQPNGGFPNTTVTLGTDPNQFIKGVVNALRTMAPNQAFQTFENLPNDDLEWLPELNNQPVYNFALCRVRYRATVTKAADVRVFFRLFQTAATGTDYNPQTTYRKGGQPGVKIPLLGIQGGELVTIPFFAEPRNAATVPLNMQTDDTNKHTIDPAGGGHEAYMYFGCWLDINQPTDLRFPIQPSPSDGPFGGTLKSIADLIRGTHQCMVAEIDYDPDPIQSGVSPASSDKLSQRNLVIDHSANPGVSETHRVQHTFTIRPTAVNATATANAAPAQRVDELMIDWGNTPPGSVATLYLPSLRAAEVLDLAARRFNLQTLEAVDDSTLRCRTAGVTYVPIPPGGTVDIAGLITVDLPPTVRKGQDFRIVMKQVTEPPPQPVRVTERAATVGPRARNQRLILGAFQFTVVIRTAAEMLPRDVRTFTALQRMAETIPPENRWHLVVRRYLAQLGARTAALGRTASPPSSFSPPSDRG